MLCMGLGRHTLGISRKAKETEALPSRVLEANSLPQSHAYGDSHSWGLLGSRGGERSFVLR